MKDCIFIDSQHNKKATKRNNNEKNEINYMFNPKITFNILVTRYIPKF